MICKIEFGDGHIVLFLGRKIVSHSEQSMQCVDHLAIGVWSYQITLKK